MEKKRILELRLQKEINFGNKDIVQKLLNSGVDVNAQHPVNGWTPLHAACKKGHLDLVLLLLKNGADKNIRTNMGETPASMTNDQQILHLLNESSDMIARFTYDSFSSITPVHPDFSHANMNLPNIKSNAYNEYEVATSLHNELVLKIRIANATDPDFVEIEMARNELTYQALLSLCCKELDISAHQILKLRKLPNTKLRKDKDVQRLQNFQEIEVVTDMTNVYKSIQNSNGISNNLPTLTPANGYQSISKKDQTILY